MARLNRPLLTALALGLIAWLLFLWGVETPSKYVFDEVYYVEASKGLLRLHSPENVEHPLFAKLLIGLGMRLFGENAFGWRFFSTLSGAAIVMATFWIGWQLFGRLRPSIHAALFVLLNFLVFVQSRIAMLDGIMTAFIMLAIGAMLRAARAPAGESLRWLIGAGVLLGLATGSKWAAAPYVAYACLAIIALRVLDARAGGKPLSAILGADQRFFAGIRLTPALLILGGTSVAVYALTFAPAFFYEYERMTIPGFFTFHARMWAQQTQVLPPHPYQSSWWSWPLDLRGIWYLYEFADGEQRGILLIGNPAVFWGGLLAVFACLEAAWEDKSRTLVGVASLWLGSMALWPILPKKIGFLYYYYPSSIFLGLALAAAFDRSRRHKGRNSWGAELYLLLCAGLFVYFLPILSAAALPDKMAFLHYTWLDSWR